MKLRANTFRLTALVLALLAPLPGLRAASTRTNLVRKSPTMAQNQTNAVPEEPTITQSVFTIPATPQDGKDPFFPGSLRIYASINTKTNTNSKTTKVATVVNVVLTGISGPGTARPLASINNHTFGPGEEGDVLTNTGRVRIRCIEIREDAVLVEIGGEQRELRLPRGR